MASKNSPAPLSDRPTPEGTVPGPEHATHTTDAVHTRLQDDVTPGVAGAALGVGSLLAGYRLVQRLGEGGMGAVFIAEDVTLRRQVAIKIMKADVAVHESSKQRFFREARAAARLEHDNIVGIHQIGEESGVPFLVMPLLKGESLGSRLRREPRLPIPVVLKLARDIADGLACAHEHGLIHRDIKPDNIWVEPLPKNSGDRAKILDFGLVRPQTEIETLVTQEGAILGTPAFMSPEQACGMPVDARSDLFSLGIVLYCMTIGRRPFTGSNTIALLSSLATETPPAPMTQREDVPPELSDLIMKLLEKDPKVRIQTAHEVGDALRQLQPDSVVVVTAPHKGSEKSNHLADVDTRHVDGPARPLDVTLPFATPVGDVTPTEIDRAVLAESRRAGDKRPTRPTAGRSLLPVFALLLVVGGGIIAAILFVNRTKDPQPVRIEVVTKGDEPQPTPAEPIALPVIKQKEPELIVPVIKEKEPEILPVIKMKEPEIVPVVKMKEPESVIPVAKLVDPEVGPSPRIKEPDPVAIVTKKESPPDVVVAPPKPTGYALQFHEGSSVQVPNLKLDRTGPFTVEAYVTPGQKNFAGQNPIVFFPGQMWLSIPYSFWNVTVHTEGNTAGTTLKFAVKESKRMHIAAVRTDRQLLLFVDGKLVSSKDCPKNDLALTKGTLLIGSCTLPKESSFDGLIDEVRISSSARYEKDFAPNPRFVADAATVALYHFDEGTGELAKDVSGHDHHGQIINAKWVKPDGSPVTVLKKFDPKKDFSKPKS